VERLGAAPPVSADYRMPNPARGSFDVSVYESNARLLEVSRADLDVTFGALAPHLLTTQDQVVHGHLADPDACSSMVETRHLFSVLSNDGFAPERIGLFSAGTGEVPIDVTRRELHGVADPFSSHLAVGAAAFLVASGGSLVLRRAEDIFEGLRSVCRSIQRATGAHVNANVYVSHGNDSGLGLHWDEHDVLAVQLAGTRRWVVRHNQSDAPLRERMIARGLPPVPPTGVGDVASDSVVCPGDALLIPRGCHHEVVSTDELSVHVSFGFTYPIGLGVVGHHQPENIDRPEARREARRTVGGWALPELGIKGEDRAWDSVVAAALALLPVRSTASVDAMIDAFRAPDLGGWRFSWTASGSAVLHQAGREAQIATGGRLVRFAPTLLRRFPSVASSTQRCVDSLIEEVGSDFDDRADAAESIRIALCELAIEGLVELAPPHARVPSPEAASS